MPTRAATRTKRLTRGPRKGQVITVYAKNGKPVKAVVAGTGKNRQKGNPRANKKFVTSIDSKGRTGHTYTINGKKTSVTIKGKRNAAVAKAKSVRSKDGKRRVLTVRQRQNAVRGARYGKKRSR